MSNEEVKTTIGDSELVDVECSLPIAVLKTAHERTQLALSDLGALNAADKEILAKMTNLDIDLSDGIMNSQNIEEALATLKDCTQLKALRLKMPKTSI